MYRFIYVVLIVGLVVVSTYAENYSFDPLFTPVETICTPDTTGYLPIIADVFPTSSGDELIFTTLQNTLEIYSSTGGFLFSINLRDDNINCSTVPSTGRTPQSSSGYHGVPCVGDFNGDGYLDIAITRFIVFRTPLGTDYIRWGRSTIDVLIAGSSGGFDANSEWISYTDELEVSSHFVICKDVNGDSKDELFVAGLKKMGRASSSSNFVDTEQNCISLSCDGENTTLNWQSPHSFASFSENDRSIVVERQCPSIIGTSSGYNLIYWACKLNVTWLDPPPTHETSQKTRLISVNCANATTLFSDMDLFSGSSTRGTVPLNETACAGDYCNFFSYPDADQSRI